MKLQDYLKEHRLIMDGAMGTYFEEKYKKEAGIAELANITAPEKVLEIHREYLESGARMLRTNTFASNTMLLDDIEAVKENVRAGYEIAQRARAEFYAEHEGVEEIYVAADLGPIYPVAASQVTDAFEQEILEEYKAIVDTFAACGAEVYVLETLADLTYAEAVAAYIKEKSDAFVLVQFSFDKSGYTKSGLSIANMFARVNEIDAIDACGCNCGVAAAHLNQLLTKERFPGKKYVSALPNGSYPYELRGRMVYSNNEKYYTLMMEKIAELGVDILGGCCGTKPSYIKRLSESLKDGERPDRKVFAVQEQPEEELPLEEKVSELSAFYPKLQREEKVFVVELDPPFGLDITKVIEGAKCLKKVKADLITLADSPMARTRMDPLQLAVKVQNETGIHVMPHICCRDKNMIAMRSSLLGAYMNEIRNFLFITGDPVSRDSRDQITSVFNFNSIRLMQYVSEMNQDVFQEEPVVYFGALNYHGANPAAIAARMKKKMEAGCAGFLTQPVYSEEDMERICYLKQETGAKILCGIMPLVSYKNAMFIKNEMPGIKVTDDIVAKYRSDMTREEAEHVAVETSVEIAERLYDKVDGFYMMTPFNRAGLIARIIESIREKCEK